jgi:hypothetical protein
MTGYIWMGEPGKVQKGARQVFDMLRTDQGFDKTDVTLLISCINRRLVELMAGYRSGTEAEILKEGLASSQVIGFLAYGEMSFTNLMQEPYTYGFTSWGITFHSKEERKQDDDQPERHKSVKAPHANRADDEFQRDQGSALLSRRLFAPRYTPRMS